jgi:ankyrin repeat protein
MKESCDHFICVQDRRTPLHLACGHGAVGLVSELLAAGAQVDAQDEVWTVEIRVDLSSSGSKDSPPSCLL